MNIKTKGHYIFSFSQKCQKHFQKGCGYKYSFARMMVMKLRNGRDAKEGVEYIAAAITDPTDRDTYVEVKDMEEGEYYFFIEPDWHEET